nr:hypothetical protein [Fredinandcohnia onubensis]
MTKLDNLLNQLVQSVDEAEHAVIESQGNGDRERFQHAQNLVMQAKEQLREVENSGVTEDLAYIRAKALLRRLEETQRAIEATTK